MAKYDPDKHCGGQRANQPPGTLCTRPKGWGTPHPGIGRCKRHMGATANHVRAAEKEMARRECARLGLQEVVHPAEALLRLVWECAGNVAYYRSLVEQLPSHPDPDVFHPPEGEDGQGWWERGEPGIYGRTYHVSGIPTGEAKPNVLVQMYDAERERLRQACDSALKANVDERRVRLAERDATAITNAQMATLTALGLEDRRDDFRRVFAEQLRAGAEPAAVAAGRSARPSGVAA